MNVAVYSAIYGGYDRPKPARYGAPATLYVDSIRSAPGWRVRRAEFTHRPPAVLRAKYWKLHPEIACPDAEISIWVDGSLTPTVDNFVERCLEALGDDDWSMMPHPWRDCVYDEAEACLEQGRADPVALRLQMEAYRYLGHPEHWGLQATGVLVRRHTPAVAWLCRHWWRHCLKYTPRDQLSLPVLLRQAEPGWLRWNTRVPWAEWWSNAPHGS